LFTHHRFTKNTAKKPFSAKRVLSLGALPVTLVLVAALSGCSGGSAGKAAAGTSSLTTASPSATPAPSSAPLSSAATRTPSPSAEPADPIASTESKAAMTQIVIEFDGMQIAGELDDSAASASLIDQLPLTLSFRDFGGQEKIADLPAPLNLDGAPAGSEAPPLTIGYYAPNQGLVLYYDRVGYFAGIVQLGTFDNADAFIDQTSDFIATIHTAN
jgi:hypothetical protein